MLEFFKSHNSNRMRFEIAGFEIAGSNRQIAGFGHAKEDPTNLSIQSERVLRNY